MTFEIMKTKNILIEVQAEFSLRDPSIRNNIICSSSLTMIFPGYDMDVLNKRSIFRCKQQEMPQVLIGQIMGKQGISKSDSLSKYAYTFAQQIKMP